MVPASACVVGAGTRVALVGCAASAVGGRAGEEIDAADVVARVNFGCPPLADLRADIGARTDILYHVLREGRRWMDAADVDRWHLAGVRLVVAVHPVEAGRVRRVARWLADAGIELRSAADVRARLRAELATTPNTGVVAVTDLLAAPLRTLAVYGMDFYRSGHWLGQGGETAAQAAAQAGGARGHNQPRQRRYIAGLARADRRLVLSGPVAAALAATR